MMVCQKNFPRIKQTKLSPIFFVWFFCLVFWGWLGDTYRSQRIEDEINRLGNTFHIPYKPDRIKPSLVVFGVSISGILLLNYSTRKNLSLL